MKKIRHTGITVANLDLALWFYRDLLGLKVAIKANEESDYIDNISGFENIKLEVVKLITDDGSMIELLHYLSHPKKGIYRKLYEIGISHVAFEVDDIDVLYNKLSDEGILFNSPPTVSPDNYAKVAFCHDLESNSIELVQVL